MIFTKPRKDCEQFRTQNTTNIWRENINVSAHLWRENAKTEYSNKKMAQKYMTLYQTEINNFCINDLFHEYNRKLHYRLTK